MQMQTQSKQIHVWFYDYAFNYAGGVYVGPEFVFFSSFFSSFFGSVFELFTFLLGSWGGASVTGMVGP